MENTQILRIDLTHRPRLRGLLRSRWPQFALRAIGLAGLVLVILTGWFGSPVGSQNFAIMLVWIGWWTALKLVLLPFGGRSWCSICPIPMPGDWLQQGWLVRPGGKGLNRGRRWPRRLRNTWLQAAGFAAIGLFSAVTLTTPVVTAWVFFGLIAAALVVSLVFEQRSFCRYLCPMGGFIGTYAVLAPIELRPQPDSAARYQAARDWPRGCPWINNPAALKANTNCGLCLECLRTPSGDTMSLNLRPFDLELSQPNPFRLDEAFLSLILLSSVLVYTAVFQGPWGWLKQAAFSVGSPSWWSFAAGFLLVCFGLRPGLLAAASEAARRLAGLTASLRVVFSRFSRALLPLGMLAWIAFTVSFSFGKLAYLWPVLSDPFGWGWNLFGTAGIGWQPYLTALTPALESLLVGVGLVWSLKSIRRTGTQLGIPDGKSLAVVPVQTFALAVALGMLWLLIG